MLWLCLRKVILKIIRRFRQCFFWDIHVSGEHLGVKRKRFLKRIIATTDFCNRNRWIAYLQRSQHRLGKDVFGEDLYTPTTNFPKKVVSSDANAKLLSANDSTNFTFRGRFSSKEQALLVDSASSQKINSTLRWLVNNHGTLTGNQAIVVWAIKRPEEKPVLNPQSGSFDFDDSFSSIADESKALHDDISDALNATNPIAIDDVQITKSVNSETTDSGKKSSDTMGMKYRVSGRAVYVTYGSISPQLAERTGFSAEDAEKIKEALVTLFENDESSARPSGSMEVLDVVWFAHNCKGGQYSSAKVHRSVSVDADGTVNVDDASIPGLRYEVIEGR